LAPSDISTYAPLIFLDMDRLKLNEYGGLYSFLDGSSTCQILKY
jgi:hypothetical protein